MRLNSQKGYSLIEVGVGLILITIFMVCGATMLRGTYSTYRYIEQRNMVMAYLIKAIEIETIGNDSLSITQNPANTVVKEDTIQRTVKETVIPGTTIKITTTLETLENKDGKSYLNSKVKLLTANAEFYIRKNDETSKKNLMLKTLRVEGDEG